MSDSLSIIGTKSLKEITLPGTHDSGAYHLSHARMPGIDDAMWLSFDAVALKQHIPASTVAISWGQCQSQIISHQLLGGIRYFDLRVGWDSATAQWVAFHYVIGASFDSLLQEFSRFLKEHSGELLVLEMTHFVSYPGPEQLQDLKNSVYRVLGEYLHPVDVEFKFTVNSMVQSGKRVVVTMEEGYDGVDIWPPECIHNTYADSPKVGEMVKFNEKTIGEYMGGASNNALFKISWTLTPDEVTVLESVKTSNN